MKILFLIWNYRPGIEGGSERQARLIAGELVKRGYFSTVWTAWQESDWPKQEMQDGISVLRFGTLAPWQNRARRLLDRFHRVMQSAWGGSSPAVRMRYERFRDHFDFWVMLPMVWLSRWSFMREVCCHAKKRSSRPDVIHLHEPSWLGGFAVQLAQSWESPVLCQEATNPVLPVMGYDVPFRRRIEGSRKNAHFIAMAPYLADGLRLRGIPEERIHFLPNGVKIPEAPGQPEKSQMVLYVGNFSQGAHWKGFDVLFEAWAVVHSQNRNAKLVLLGGGDRSVWEKYVVQLGCAESVEFAGWVSNPDFYYQKAAMFILPSRVEGLSNALLEAQSWGLPCVVSDIPGNRAVVEEDVNGLVVSTGDADSLARALLRLLGNAELRLRLGRSARARAIREYDIDLVAERLAGIYQRISTLRTTETTGTRS